MTQEEIRVAKGKTLEMKPVQDNLFKIDDTLTVGFLDRPLSAGECVKRVSRVFTREENRLDRIAEKIKELRDEAEKNTAMKDELGKLYEVVVDLIFDTIELTDNKLRKKWEEVQDKPDEDKRQILSDFFSHLKTEIREPERRTDPN